MKESKRALSASHYLAPRMAARGIFWVSRAKDNLGCRVKKRLPKSSDPRILKDELVALKGHRVRQDYPGLLRRVTARVEVDGEERVMVFLTNHRHEPPPAWSISTAAAGASRRSSKN